MQHCHIDHENYPVDTINEKQNVLVGKRIKQSDLITIYSCIQCFFPSN